MNHRSNKVLLTRRRWDAYMLPLFLAVAGIGLVRTIQSGQLRYALLPAVVMPIWLMLRLQTPRDGRLTSTVRSTPGAIVMLGFAFAAMLSMSILFIIDIYVIGHPFRSQLEPYHVLLFAPPFIIMFVGAFLAERVRKQHKLSAGIIRALADEELPTNKPMDRSEESAAS